MSSPKRATRLSLLAGASLAAVFLAAPVAAFASDECAPADGTTLTDGAGGVSDPTLNGGTADSFTCAGGAEEPGTIYDPGITYTASGNLTVTTTGVISVSTTDTGTQADRGINLTATGADTITWDSRAGAGAQDGQLRGGEFTDGPIIDAASVNGAITIRADSIGGASSSATAATNPTHAIRAVASGAGNIVIETGGINSGGLSGDAPPGVSAVEAHSQGGDVSIVSSAFIFGRQYGVRASTTGDGDLTISAQGIGSRNEVNAGIAVVTASTGTGLLTVGGRIDGEYGYGVLATAGGDVVLNLAGGYTQYAVADVTGVAGRTVTLNNTERMENSTLATATQTLIRVSDADLVVNNTGIMKGYFDLSEAGRVDWTNGVGGEWRPRHALFTANADTMTNLDGGTIYARSPLDTAGGVEAPLQVDFGAGADTLANGGVLLLGPLENLDYSNADDIETDVQFIGLEAFNNSGLILMGGQDGVPGITDRWFDDVLTMEGATFTGSGDSRIKLDVNFNGAQDACDASQRNADGDLPAADCLRLVDGATAGETRLIVNDIFGGDRGIYNPDGIVLVDVSGGTSAAGDFVLDPTSEGYSAANGGVIDKGFFFYPLIYDEDTQQHKLVGLPGENAMQFPILAQAAQSLWRTSTGTWFDRQADLRGGEEEEDVRGGAWMRVATEFADRDTVQSIVAPGGEFTFAGSFKQDSYAVTGGLDFIVGGGEGTSYTVGLMAGYAHADVDYQSTANSATMNGWTGGAYASYVSGGLFVDAAVNASKLILEVDVPGLNLFPADAVLDTNVMSVGFQAEAGYRFALADTAFVEPIASVSYVRTSSDLLEIEGADPSRPRVGIDFDDPVSFRAALGARLGLDQDYGSWRAQYSGLVRVWNEFEDETAVIVSSLGPSTQVTDQFSGQFTEVGVGASVQGMNGLVSGFLNLGGRFGDDYQATTASSGVRVSF